MTDGETAREALSRLVADKHRPNGITMWCDAHRPDLEITVRGLGVVSVAEALGMNASSLYAYVEHRQMERRDMRVHKAAPAAPVAPAPAPAPAAVPVPQPTPDHETAGALNGDAATEVKAKSVPYVLWTLARQKGWTIHEVDALLSARLKRVDDRSPGEWQAIADLYRRSPDLFVDAKGRAIGSKE